MTRRPSNLHGRHHVHASFGAHRGGPTVLLPGLTGDDLADHTDHAAWLGEPAPPNLAVFGG